MTPNQPVACPCLVVLVGPPGSGKSTWARRNRGGVVHVSQDDLIDAITPGGFNHVYRPIYRHAEDAVARAALRTGQTVIVDRTNRTRAHRERWVQLAREESCPALAVVMSTPIELCRQRNAQREGPRRVSDERIERMFAAFEPVSPDEGFLAVHFDSGVGPGIGLIQILSIKEHVSHEYCYEAR
jgi:predicted kinase